MEKRRECGTGTKAADLSRIKNIPLGIFLFFFFFFPNRPLKKYCVGAEKRSVLKPQSFFVPLCV